MQLTYRGVRYQQPTSAIAPSSIQLTGRYRGAIVTIRQVIPASIPNSSLALSYRGVSYLTSHTLQPSENVQLSNHPAEEMA